MSGTFGGKDQQPAFPLEKPFVPCHLLLFFFFFLPNPQARENSHLTKFFQMTGNETLVSNLFFEIENRRKDTCRLLSPGT